jgi:hypothetical protein
VRSFRCLDLAGLTRFACALALRPPDPSRFLKATPDVADCTIYAERVMPARLARRSIISIWFSRAVTLTRIHTFNTPGKFLSLRRAPPLVDVYPDRVGDGGGMCNVGWRGESLQGIPFA